MFVANERPVVMRKWQLGIVAFVALASLRASAANLVNKGGTSDVPTYEGRVYLIKASGTSCPSGFTCFCNSGSQCTLPSSPTTITGTIVIDRPGVTLDCQDRIIQPPRFAGSRQVCTGGPAGAALEECGVSASGYFNPCVNGYCQLARLAGINVGGPLAVDDTPAGINVNVNTTDDNVKDVEIRNCVVRNFGAGLNADGSSSDDGLDGLELRGNEFRTSFFGMRISNKDGIDTGDNWIHDNIYPGMKIHGVWGLASIFDRVENNGFHAVIVHVRNWGETLERRSRWIRFAGGVFSGDGDVMKIEEVEGTGAQAPCDRDPPVCDLQISGSSVIKTDSRGVAAIYATPFFNATFLLRDNWLYSSDDHVWDRGASQHRCWDDHNNCYHGPGGPAMTCAGSAFSQTTTCWY